MSAKSPNNAEHRVYLDPTANTRDLLADSNRRQDDLRTELAHRFEEALAHTEDIVKLKAEHLEEVRQIESNRVDQLRTTDILTRDTAFERTLGAIQTLAVTTATSSDVLRQALTSTAAGLAQQLDQRMGVVSDRVSALEKAAYIGTGRSSYAEPMLDELLKEVKSLHVSRESLAGQRIGVGNTLAMLVAAGGFIMSVVVFVITYIK